MKFEAAIEAFSALAQETRLGVLRALIKSGPQGAAAGALAAEFAASPPVMSFHLKALAQAGLVTARKRGRSIHYAADYGGLRALVDFLMAECCQGDPRLCGPYVVNKEKCNEAPACAS
jgi:DNA-binding transcriptional ArsR family regulator